MSQKVSSIKRPPNTKLRQARELRGWGQKDVADKLSIADDRTVRRWEKGEAIPTPYYRQKLCDLFGMNAIELGFVDAPPATGSEETSSTASGANTTDPSPTFTPPAPSPLHTENTYRDVSLAQNIEDDRSNDTESQLVSHRSKMLDRVYTLCVLDQLEDSFQGGTLITLALENKIDAIHKAVPLASHSSQQQTRAYPPGTHIVDVYRKVGKELLILGQPGSGKTILLLELTRDLLIRARQDEHSPIPVFLRLTEWAPNQRQFVQWVFDEIFKNYLIPREIARSWLEKNQLVLLLDGLDEVRASSRTACIQALNHFHQQYTLIPIVVSCRTQDYLASAQRLNISKVVAVQPLNWQQIEQYLLGAHLPLRGLWAAMQQDERLRQMASSPLLLRLLALMYNGKLADEILSNQNQEKLERVFQHYTEEMYANFQRLPHTKRYKPQQVQRGLTWLATQLKRHNQTEFYPERMQLSWLPENHLRRVHRGITTRVVGGLVIGLNNWESFFKGHWSNVLHPASLLYGLISLLLFCCIGGWLFDLTTEIRARNDEREASPRKIRGVAVFAQSFTGQLFLGDGVEIRKSSQSSWVPLTLKRTLIQFVRGWIAGTILFAIAFALIDNFILGHRSGFFVGVAPGILDGSFFGLIGATVGRLRTEIRPAESIRWSWQNLRQSWTKTLLNSLIFALALGLTLSFIYALRFPYRSQAGVLQGLFEGFVPGCISALIYIMFSGLSVETVELGTLIRPNEGIRRSLQNGLVIGFISTILLSCLITTLWLLDHHKPGVADNIEGGVLFGLSYGSVGGSIISLLGALAYIEQLILRILLSMTKSLPYRYIPFLDACVSHILLRKIGNGYMFIHQLLLEYYATLGEKEQPTQLSERKRPEN